MALIRRNFLRAERRALVEQRRWSRPSIAIAGPEPKRSTSATSMRPLPGGRAGCRVRPADGSPVCRHPGEKFSAARAPACGPGMRATSNFSPG